MKKKLLILGILGALAVVAFLSRKKLKTPLKIAAEVITCTSNNFLSSKDIDTTKQIAPLLKNVGAHTFPLNTKSEEAQVYFNQGLNLVYGFNHTESHRSFLEASRLDPTLAMAHWGQALALGPNINDRNISDERKKDAYKAIQKAKELSDNQSSKEKALIEALSTRYGKYAALEKAKLDMAYVNAMSEVVAQFPDDTDVLTLYASAIMNTVPWNYWDKDDKPAPNIEKAKASLEHALKIDPNHPGANHYYIHLVEASKPDLGIASAEKLESLNLNSGHLTHMPSHIYVRVGRYEEAVKVNQLAILADEDYITQCFSQGLYPLEYYPHNILFLWSAASMMGNSELTIDAGKKILEKITLSKLDDSTTQQYFAATPLLAYLRFGKWDDILTHPNPTNQYAYLKLFWHYTRGIAFLRKNNLKDAQEELDFISARDKNLGYESIAKVIYEVLAGEVEAFKGNYEVSISHLKNATIFEDDLGYNEPAAWYIPTRQTLGAVLLKAKKYTEAQKIYEEDLAYNRQNGWSLMGLYQSLLMQGKAEEAEMVKEQFDIAWSKSDIEISSSIL